MATWQEKWPVEYSAASDENIDSWAQKYISEISRIYSLMNRVRMNDLKAGEPDDTTPWQWHADFNKDALYLRNPNDDAWIPVGKLNTTKTRFVFDQAVANNGGCPSMQIGNIADRPAEETDGAVFISLDESKTYRYNAATENWKYIDTLILKDTSGKIIGDLAGKADDASHADEADHATNADHATAATNSNYAATAARTEIANTADKLTTAVKINGISFDGSQSINIPTGTGDDDSDISAYQQLLWRTDRNERDIASLALASENAGIYPDYNSLLVENFVNDYDVDVSKINVTSIATGDDSIDVDDVTKVIKGQLYMLADGTNQEYVQVKDLMKNGTTQRVVLNTQIINTYNPSNTVMYRTTASLKNGTAEGTGTNAILSWAPDINWAGINTAVETTLKLDTSLTNTSNFNITGDIVLDGTITLAGDN